jgi:hypothetical protein
LKEAFVHRATATFCEHYHRLPEKVRVRADANFVLLKSDPFHASLHFKKVRGELWSVRVGLQYRALAIPEDSGFAWIWIGSHAEYDRLVG